MSVCFNLYFFKEKISIKKLTSGIFIFSFLLISIFAFGQTHNSVEKLAKALEQESLGAEERIDLLNEIASTMRAADPSSTQYLTYAYEALAAAKKIRYEKGEAYSNLNIGFYHLSKLTYVKSIEYGFSALYIFEQLNDKKGLMLSYLLLGKIYRNLKETDLAENYLNQSVQLAQELNDTEAIARGYSSLGLIARDRGDDKKALALLTKAMNEVENKDNHFRINVLGNVGSIYIHGNELDKALPFLNTGLAIAQKQRDKSGEAFMNLNFGKLYSKLNDLNKAEKFLLTCEDLSLQIDDKKYLMEAYEALVELKTKAGKIQQASEYQTKYNKVKVSILNPDKAHQIAKLALEYETEKKERAIKLLEHEKEIQSTWKNILVVGFLFVFTIAVVIFYLLASRARKAKQLLTAQESLGKQLKEVDQLKTSFFANISHEFRTPLTLILAPLENELKKKSTPEAKEGLLLVKRNANRLLELVNQLLDLSKIESGKMDLRIKQGTLKPILEVIATSFNSLADYKKIKFVKKIDIQDKFYWYDQDKVEKIITNLLANVFKQTNPNGIVSIIVSTEQNSDLSILISNNPNGIDRIEFKDIYPLLNNDNQFGVNHPQGTALGLSLVKELVNLYGGTISFENTEATGITFHVKLPTQKNAFDLDHIFENDHDNFQLYPTSDMIVPEQNEESKETELLMDHKDSVLVVEDNEELKEFISSTLQSYDYSVLAASNGEEALQLAIKYVPNLVLSDLMMPRMNGIELTAKIKEDERISHIPVVLLTAKNESQSRIESLKSGADDYLTKPFSPDELLIRIGNLIEQRKKLAIKFRERILVSTTPSKVMSLDEKFVQKARNVVENYLGDYDFTVEQMAEEMNLSRTQLLRKIKALTGLSPNDFIKDIRLKRAAEMISKKVDSITQIGYTVGFNDQSYFTKCFKKHFGITPSDYSGQMVNNK
jgi:DNA-binding response OmpR family regulator/signal transduction histidine kinase